MSALLRSVVVGGSSAVPCFHPLTAYRLSNGTVVFAERGDVVKQLQLPCGRCVGCRLERSRQWAIRIMHESQCHNSNCFITLTYDDKHLPDNGSLVYKDFQDFMKRLRKSLPDRKVRYFVAGEYGDQLGRPHFHACIFGYDFSLSKTTPVRKNAQGDVIYQSAELDVLWGNGFASVGALTFQSAAYVARYVLKKVTGSKADAHYKIVEPDTGEIVGLRVPEFCAMSLKPGIGANWFARFHADVFPHDYVVANGFPSKPPRYYDVLLKRISPDVLEDIKFDREVDGLSRYQDNTPERLAVRETVAKSRLSFRQRNLK